MCLLLLPFRKRNAFSVETLITSNAVVLLGMLSIMNAEKLDTLLRFVGRSLLARRAQQSRLHFCLSTTSLPLSDPRLAYNLLLLALKSRDCQPVLCWTSGHRPVTNSEVAKTWVRMQRSKLKQRFRVKSQQLLQRTWSRKL